METVQKSKSDDIRSECLGNAIIGFRVTSEELMYHLRLVEFCSELKL